MNRVKLNSFLIEIQLTASSIFHGSGGPSHSTLYRNESIFMGLRHDKLYLFLTLHHDNEYMPQLGFLIDFFILRLIANCVYLLREMFGVEIMQNISQICCSNLWGCFVSTGLFVNFLWNLSCPTEGFVNLLYLLGWTGLLFIEQLSCSRTHALQSLAAAWRDRWELFWPVQKASLKINLNALRPG